MIKKTFNDRFTIFFVLFFTVIALLSLVGILPSSFGGLDWYKFSTLCLLLLILRFMLRFNGWIK